MRPGAGVASAGGAFAGVVEHHEGSSVEGFGLSVVLDGKEVARELIAARARCADAKKSREIEVARALAEAPAKTTFVLGIEVVAPRGQHRGL